MKTTELYDKVCLVKPVPMAVFRLYLSLAVNDLTARYGDKYTATQGEIPVYDAYKSALIYGILHQITGLSEYMKIYEDQAQNAYLSVWRNRKAERREALNDVSD